MNRHDVWSYRFFVNVQFEVDTDDQLGEDGNNKDVGEGPMYGRKKRASFMRVSKEIPSKCERVPSRLESKLTDGGWQSFD